MVILKNLFTPRLKTNTFWKFPWGQGWIPGAGLVVGLELGNHRREVLTNSSRVGRSQQRKGVSSKPGGFQRPHTALGSVKDPLWPNGPNGPNPGCMLESPVRLVYRNPPLWGLISLAEVVPSIATEVHPPGDPSGFSSLQPISGTIWGPICCILHTGFLNKALRQAHRRGL